MFANMLLTFGRQLQRHRLYTVLNVLGLACGIATFLTLALIVRYETSFDTALPDARHLYRLDMSWHPAGRAPSENPGSSFVPYPFLQQDFPAIAHAVRVLSASMPVRVGQQLAAETVTMTDPDFFSVFALPIVAGPARGRHLDGPSMIVIPARIARRYFGTVQAVGRQMQIDNDHMPSTVTAVYADPPPNSSVDFGILTVFPSQQYATLPFTNWGSQWGAIWIRVDDPAAVAAIGAGLHDYVARHPVHLPATALAQDFAGAGLTLVGLPDVHFHDAAITGSGTSRQLVTILELVGIAALATAIVNYVNLATARAGMRAREVAIRKVMGASRGALVLQFMGEALALVACSALVGLAMVEVGLAWIDTLSGWTVALDMSFVLPLVVLIVLAVGLVAGLYPALVLAAFRPAPVLAASRTPAGGRRAALVRNMLVVLQFSFAIVLAICTLVMTRQAAFVRDAQRGLRQEGVIVIPALDDDSLRQRQADIVDRLRQVPGVVSATRSDMFPHHLSDSDNWYRDGSASRFSANWGYATPDYFATYHMRLLAGRLFDAAHGDDYPDTGKSGDAIRNIVISRLAAHDFGFATPDQAIGRLVREEGMDHPYRVIGVIDDVRFNDMHSPVAALIFIGTRRPIDYVAASIRYAGMPQPVAMRRLRAAWRAIAPDVPFDGTGVPDIFAADYRADLNHGRLFAIGAAIAILIACLGLYGLSAFTLSRRRHEIAIRKVMGARARDILLLLSGQFIRPVLLANLIAWPIAWVLMRVWLAGFDQRIALAPGFFIVVGLAAAAMALITVIGQTLRMAGAEPARTLRQN